MFQDLCSEFCQKSVLARDLASFQAGVGMIFAGEHDAPRVQSPLMVTNLTPPLSALQWLIGFVACPFRLRSMSVLTGFSRICLGLSFSGGLFTPLVSFRPSGIMVIG